MSDSLAKITVSLPDNTSREYNKGVTPYEVALDIGEGLAKASLAAEVNGTLVDLSIPIEADVSCKLLTGRDEESLDLIRHDAAHVLAEAAKELWPDIQVTIGPVIKDCFYYDFAREAPFTPEDLVALEDRMREIVDRDEPITREVWGRQEALEFFASIGETYKAEIVRDLSEDEVLTVYKQGKFVDLCRGPHLPSTGKLGTAFKLTRIAGAYWR